MYNANRLKVNLKLAINRLKMLQAKKASITQAQRREIATLLSKHKEESARVRVEHIIREDLLMEAMEMLELYCDLLLARFGLLDQYKTCEPSIAEAVHTIIWASPRTDEVKELGVVRDQLASKFGKEFAMNALENADDMVNARVMAKLEVSAPDPYLVERYLEEIARTYDVVWASSILAAEQEDASDDDSDGGLNEAALMEPPLVSEHMSPKPKSLEPKNTPPPPSQPEPEDDDLEDTPELPDIPSKAPPGAPKRSPTRPEKPTPPPTSNNGNSMDSADDELARRLAALKKR